MKYTVLIFAMLLASCDGMTSNTQHVTDTATGGQLVPVMPVLPTDTAAAAPMPTVDPDTSKIQPK